MIILRTNDGHKLALSAYLIGGDALFDTMARQTTLPVAELLARARAAA